MNLVCVVCLPYAALIFMRRYYLCVDEICAGSCFWESTCIWFVLLGQLYRGEPGGTGALPISLLHRDSLVMLPRKINFFKLSTFSNERIVPLFL
jgi:hypothetical protein